MVYKFTDGRKGWYFQGYFNGKKYKKERYNGKHMNTKADAMAAESDFLKEKEIELTKINEGFGIYELFDDFVKNAKQNLKVSTRNTYDKFKRNYLVLIDNKKLSELKVSDLTEWLGKLSQINANEDYINRQRNIMRTCLDYGNKIYNLNGNLQLPLLNKFNDNSIVENEKKLEKFVPIKDFKKMMNYLDTRFDDQFFYYTIFNLMYWTGIRVGELIALTPNDITADGISINKNYIRIKGIDYIQSPKTKNSIRIVSVDDNLRTILNEYLTRFKPVGTLFTLKSKYLSLQVINRNLKKLGACVGLDKIYDLHAHSLRHSHASNLRQLGYDEFVIAERLGNTPQTSRSVYIHTDSSEDLKLLEKLKKMH